MLLTRTTIRIMMKTISHILAFLFLCLGILGAILPLLPTTPFLLLASYFFAKGSPKFNAWFKSLPLYRKHLESFENDRSMTMQTKLGILIPVSTLLIISFLLVNHLHARIAIFTVLVAKLLYFTLIIKTIKVKQA